MRLILLLTALLSAFAIGGVPARAAAKPTIQSSKVVDVVAARVASGLPAHRHLVPRPSVRDVLVTLVILTEPATVVPLYAGRRRV